MLPLPRSLSPSHRPGTLKKDDPIVVEICFSHSTPSFHYIHTSTSLSLSSPLPSLPGEKRSRHHLLARATWICSPSSLPPPQLPHHTPTGKGPRIRHQHHLFHRLFHQHRTRAKPSKWRMVDTDQADQMIRPCQSSMSVYTKIEVVDDVQNASMHGGEFWNKKRESKVGEINRLKKHIKI